MKSSRAKTSTQIRTLIIRALKHSSYAIVTIHQSSESGKQTCLESDYIIEISERTCQWISTLLQEMDL